MEETHTLSVQPTLFDLYEFFPFNISFTSINTRTNLGVFKQVYESHLATGVNNVIYCMNAV